MSDFTEHANYLATQTEFNSVASDLAAFQATYLAANKRYWQGLISHALQTLGDSARAFTANTLPDGETQAWDVVSDETVRGSYECDNQNGGGDVPGYILRGKINHDAGEGEQTYQKEEWYGSRDDTSFDNWKPLQPET